MPDGIRRHALVFLLPAVFALLHPPRPILAQESYGLRTGDQVDLTFHTASGTEVAEISGTRFVDREGQLYLPYIGRTTVTGLDAEELRLLLLERYEAFYSNPVIEVAVKLRVNVTGTVRTPGHFFVEPASTLIDLLAMAGGPVSELDFSAGFGAADQERVQLVRDGQVEVLDFRPDHADPTTLSRGIQSGDWLYIPPRSRSRWRDNLQFFSSIVTLTAGVVGIGVVLDWW